MMNYRALNEIDRAIKRKKCGMSSEGHRTMAP